MSDNAIRTALSKRAEVEDRIRKLERRIKREKEQIIEINKFIQQWEKFSGRAVSSVVEPNALNEKGDFAATVGNSQVRMVPVNPRKEEVAEIAKQVLISAGKPLSRNELFKLLTAKGLTIHGSNPEMVLSTMLWRTRDTSNIVRLKSGGYCLKENASPEDADDSDQDDNDESED